MLLLLSLLVLTYYAIALIIFINDTVRTTELKELPRILLSIHTFPRMRSAMQSSRIPYQCEHNRGEFIFREHTCLLYMRIKRSRKKNVEKWKVFHDVKKKMIENLYVHIVFNMFLPSPFQLSEVNIPCKYRSFRNYDIEESNT